MDDIPYILKGCVPDRYQFSPHKPITPRHPAFITSPSLKDRIHCVAYVLDINSVNNLSSKMVAKFKQIHKEVLNFGIAYVALLTKVNNYDEVLQDDFLNMNQSTTSQSQIMNVNKMLNIPISNILMVENYASECQLNPLKDILILSVLRQMLRAADDFLEDLPLEKTGNLAPFFHSCFLRNTKLYFSWMAGAHLPALVLTVRFRSMTVTTRLTWVQEKSLQNHFGGKQFSLLYKASDHEFSRQVLLQICSDQGPTVTVIYSGDHVIGAFIQKSYQEENEVSVKLFAFQETEILECEIRPCTPSMLFPVGKAKPWQRNSEFNIDLQEKYMYIHSNTSKKLGLPQCDSISFKECEVFRCEGRFNQVAYAIEFSPACLEG
ncbi:hypothetical protein HPG69_011017 [Diceros bicornis minor]|uniref:TLDc domain-containing protein n=1 Tax=Diceros bicornis minor TaxID=77932 RepID=A0A7J7F6H7_DICBM|nr:hypothetical protein HPG69_011017 [Diceros bicornis minor]